MPHEHDGKVVIFAPFARDAASLTDLFNQQGIVAEAVTSLTGLVDTLGDSVGAVLMSEEALSQTTWKPLIEAANKQPSWSAYPFILLIGKKRSFREAHAIYGMLPKEISNVIVLERPLGSAVLVSAVRSALAGRRRQFVTRNHLAELERNAEHQRLLTRELAHRVKNTLAVVQSIVKQTLRPYPEAAAAQATLIDRLAALARAHDILFGADFVAADFKEVVSATLSAHAGDFRVHGASIMLSPQASLSLALVLHELATNSAKYGALHAGGTVHMSWNVSGEAKPRFAFRWAETGGPAAVEPTSPGFGTKLIKSSLTALGDADLHYGSDGFNLAFEGDLASLRHAVVAD